MKLPIEPGIKRTVLAVSLLAGLSACGGGGDDGGNAQAPGQNSNAEASVPASAVASTAAFVNYLNTTPANETAEALNAAAVTPPTTDTEEPTNV